MVPRPGDPRPQLTQPGPQPAVLRAAVRYTAEAVLTLDVGQAQEALVAQQRQLDETSQVVESYAAQLGQEHLSLQAAERRAVQYRNEWVEATAEVRRRVCA